jgi:hypothetical protein
VPTRPRHKVPDDVKAALHAAGVQAEYNARPAYQRNDYVGWIVGAKREETRRKRIRQMTAELKSGGVYMGMAHALSAKPNKPTARAARNAKASAAAKTSAAKPVLLSGGNPQIPKGCGDAPVEAYIGAMPGWKRNLGRRLDALIVRAVPGVRKAVKWNSPFYGVEEGVWFLSFHCFTKYIKVTFFRGAALRPIPPGKSKHEDVRYLDIYEDQLDEAQFTAWVRQASQLPGERM